MDQQRLTWDTVKIKGCLELKSQNKAEENSCVESRQQENDRGKWRRVVFNTVEVEKEYKG